MGTLLKDMPEHAERIENYYSLQGDIADIINIEAEIKITNGEAQIENTTALASEIIDRLIEFVNQNYMWKGAKS